MKLHLLFSRKFLICVFLVLLFGSHAVPAQGRAAQSLEDRIAALEAKVLELQITQDFLVGNTHAAHYLCSPVAFEYVRWGRDSNGNPRAIDAIPSLTVHNGRLSDQLKVVTSPFVIPRHLKVKQRDGTIATLDLEQHLHLRVFWSDYAPWYCGHPHTTFIKEDGTPMW